MPNYLLRDFDASLWHQVKTKCLAQGITIKDLLARLLKDWVNQQ